MDEYLPHLEETGLSAALWRNLPRQLLRRHMRIRVLIVDDHAVVRQGLKMFLGTDPDLEIVGEAGDGAQALRLATKLQPDIVLMDLLMPVMDGIEATAQIRRELPDVEVLALTSVLEDSSVIGAVKAGAVCLPASAEFWRLMHDGETHLIEDALTNENDILTISYLGSLRVS